MTRLSGKVAIITGGGTGIGRGIALAFARQGAKVALAARRPEKLEAVVREVQTAGGEAIAVPCDVTKAAETLEAVAKVEKAFGCLNVLVNNAGALSVSTIETVSEDDWDRVISTNVKGPFLMCRAALCAMRRAGGGAIVNIGSILGLVGMKDRAAYCASKGALTLLTKAMAMDHAHEKIRVNCICPGFVETDLVRELFSSTDEGRKARAARIATFPAGRFGRPEDIAEMAVFLASEESSWMTGTAIPVDGGLSAY